VGGESSAVAKVAAYSVLRIIRVESGNRIDPDTRGEPRCRKARTNSRKSSCSLPR
jgi:hypothetical protein